MKIDGRKTNTLAVSGVIFGVSLYFLRDVWLAVSGLTVLYSAFQYTKRDASKKTEKKLEAIEKKDFSAEKGAIRFVR